MADFDAKSVKHQISKQRGKITKKTVTHCNGFQKLIKQPNNAICLGSHGFVIEVGGLSDEGAYLTTFKNMAEIMVEKNRFGGTGDVRMYFDNHASFKDLYKPFHVSRKCRTFADSKSIAAKDRTECKDIKH
ncbi:MAG: hypothetical protein II859_13040 [Bacteroidales bacterium]|nr:hypothetical protein [Bacteroidales bacterium]